MRPAYHGHKPAGRAQQRGMHAEACLPGKREEIAMRSLSVALAAAALTLTVSTAARAQTPDIDMDKVHEAYWQMQGSNHTESLQWFEQEVNKYYWGDDYVSISAERAMIDGQPRVVVTGYVDKDGTPGYNP